MLFSIATILVCDMRRPTLISDFVFCGERLGDRTHSYNYIGNLRREL